MKALILRNDAQASVATARALIDKGFQILSVDTLAVAHALIRIETIDLLVLDERVEGQLTHSIALSGERRNPYLSAILLTDRNGEETDDLYDLIPSLYALAGSETAPELLGRLALSAVSNQQEVVARVARHAAADALEDGHADTDVLEDGDDQTEQMLVLTASDLLPPDDDTESGAPCYADVAIAAPAMAEITCAEHQMKWEEPLDPVGAEVAALFRKPALPHFLQAQRVAAAKAS